VTLGRDLRERLPRRRAPSSRASARRRRRTSPSRVRAVRTSGSSSGDTAGGKSIRAVN